MEPEDLRARSTKVQGQEKMNAPAQVERAIHPSPRGFSFSLGSSVDWMMSAHIDKGHLLIFVHQFKYSSLLEMPS